jgi:hypothetical protein
VLALGYAAGAALLVLSVLPAPGLPRVVTLSLAVPAAAGAGAVAGLVWLAARRLRHLLDDLERRLHEWAAPIAARAVERVAGTGPWAGAEELRRRVEHWIDRDARRGPRATGDQRRAGAIGRFGLRLALRRGLRAIDTELRARGEERLSAAAVERIARERLVAVVVDRARLQLRAVVAVVWAVSALAVLGPVAAWLIGR